MKKIASICILSILLVGSTSTNMTKKHLKQMKNLLNRLVITTLLAISGSISYAQYVPIPDYNFNVFLQTNYPMCMNNFQLDTTCPQITNATSLILSNLIISNLEGVL